MTLEYWLWRMKNVNGMARNDVKRVLHGAWDQANIEDLLFPCIVIRVRGSFEYLGTLYLRTSFGDKTAMLANKPLHVKYHCVIYFQNVWEIYKDLSFVIGT